MIYKKLLVFFTAISLNYQVKSCDACGGSLGSSYFGLLPQMSNSFIGFNYSFSKFSAQMQFDSEVLEDEISDDSFQRFELNTRFTIYKRLQALVILPYSLNEMNGSHQKIKDHGLGDPTILVSYRFFDNRSVDKSSVNQTLLVGIGLKLPFGQFDKLDEEEVINRNFQLGTGSIDYILSLNHTLMFEKMGLNSDFSLKINGKNSHDYRFGNQLVLATSMFRTIKFSDLLMVPLIGAYFEHGGIHKVGLVEQSNTGGKALMLNTGTQMMWNKFTFSANYKIPIFQRFNSDNIVSINAENRLVMGISYNF